MKNITQYISEAKEVSFMDVAMIYTTEEDDYSRPWIGYDSISFTDEHINRNNIKKGKNYIDELEDAFVHRMMLSNDKKFIKYNTSLIDDIISRDIHKKTPIDISGEQALKAAHRFLLSHKYTAYSVYDVFSDLVNDDSQASLLGIFYLEYNNEHKSKQIIFLMEPREGDPNEEPRALIYILADGK